MYNSPSYLGAGYFAPSYFGIGAGLEVILLSSEFDITAALDSVLTVDGELTIVNLNSVLSAAFNVNSHLKVQKNKEPKKPTVLVVSSESTISKAKVDSRVLVVSQADDLRIYKITN